MPATPKKVLVVDDSPTQAQRIRLLLESNGAAVLYGENGQAALTLAAAEQPDVILLDLQMPDMNGFEVCAHLRQSTDTRHIPIIMLTHHDDPEIIRLGLQTAGVIDYIPKDVFTDAVLLETLRQMGVLSG